jgi:hypothetical protein
VLHAVASILHRNVLAYFCFVLVGWECIPNKAYYLVYDYHDDWQVFDEQYKAYVPYIRNEHKDYNSFSLFFDSENYRGYKLLYFSSKENYLFINASLQRKLPVDQWVVMDVDSLKEKYGKTKVFLTFYGNNTSVEAISVLVGNKVSKVEKSIQISDSLLTVIPRELTPFQDYLILSILFLAICYAFCIISSQRHLTDISVLRIYSQLIFEKIL